MYNFHGLMAHQGGIFTFASMLLNRLRLNNPQSVFLSSFISLLVYGIGMFHAHDEGRHWRENSPLFYHADLEDLVWIDQLLAFVLVFLSAFLFQHVCNKHGLFTKRSQMPQMLLVLLLSVSPQAFQVSALTVGALLLVSLFDYTFRIQQANKPNDLLFLGALFVGVLSLLYTSYAVFILLVLTAYIYSGKRSFKGLVILVVGFFLPVYIFSSIAFLLDASVQFPFVYQFHFPQMNDNSTLIVLIAIVFLISLASINSLLLALNFNKVVVKNNYLMLIYFAFLCLFVASSSNYGYLQGLSLMSFFLVPVLVNHFLRIKKSWKGNLELFAIILFSVLNGVSRYWI